MKNQEIKKALEELAKAVESNKSIETVKVTFTIKKPKSKGK